MAKRVGIITMDCDAGEGYERQIREVFGSKIDVHLYSVENNTAAHIARADLYLISTGAIESRVKLDIKLPLDVHVLDIDVDFTMEDVEQLKRLPEGSKALFVNNTKFLVAESVTRLQQLGVHNLEFYPVYPGVTDIPPIPLAITPGEREYVPEGVKTIIDIGHRRLGPQMMAQIALELSMREVLDSEAFIRYINCFDRQGYFNLHAVLTKSLYIEDCFGLFAESLDEGVIGADGRGEIFCFNRKAGEILDKDCDAMGGANVTEELDFIPFAQCRASMAPIENVVKKLPDGYINVSVKPIIGDGNFKGIFAIIEKFSEAERRQQEARMQVLNKGHAAKYRFEHIIGESAALKKTKELACRMAKTDFTILIYGESGTGKELFASAIHNESDRREYPFIAINCAAMPEQLLESELFGYEEGAFTGAKKGGKLGLFEFAHSGTLFLDEIENMSPALQVKLLRVLQEREVMRVGGNKTISVDVRIIAATNENMEDAVKKGTFRKDLYYRISTLPIDLPRLNARREDVPLLFRYFRDRYGSDFQLDDDVKRAFICHNWDGNVRELQNYVEYFICLGKEQVGAEDLPQSLQRSLTAGEMWRENGAEAPCRAISESGEARRRGTEGSEALLKDVAGKRLEQYQFVLHVLYEGYISRRNIGRSVISEQASRHGIYLSEQEVRTILNRMQEKGLVSVSRGRGGSRLTGLGKSLAERYLAEESGG